VIVDENAERSSRYDSHVDETVENPPALTIANTASSAIAAEDRLAQAGGYTISACAKERSIWLKDGQTWKKFRATGFDNG
jgi:hypothetical protein